MDASAAAVAELLKKSGTEIESRIRGFSMQPTLSDGWRIRIRCGPMTFARGDIIAILADPPIAHRVVGHGRCGARAYVITRGDASWFCDVPVAQDQILGLVTSCDDGRGWRSPASFAPAGLPAALSWLSRRSILAALRVSETLASLVARGGASIGTRRVVRG